jgi:hypothetical protein
LYLWGRKYSSNIFFDKPSSTRTFKGEEMDVNYFCPCREINELRDQLSYSKRLGFFLGAGTSKSIGIPDILGLTEAVELSLSNSIKTYYDQVRKSIKDNDETKNVNIEDILNQVRLIRQITFEKETKKFDGITGKNARDLDIAICNKIYEIILEKEQDADLSHMKKLVTWLNWINRDFSKEIFTTNYDLILERAMENLQIPYFDGFIGANEPFFLPQSLELESEHDEPPNSWIRLWKLHGSLGWFWKLNPDNSYRIVRLGLYAKEKETNEIVIYPSKEKYETSRKQPFIAYFDRLKNYLQRGEGLFLISGYSFSDQHINAIIYDSLKQNNRLHIIGFFYADSDLEKIRKHGTTFVNLSAYGPKKALINGNLGEWKKDKSDVLLEKCWDNDKSEINIGDFKNLVNLLLVCSGKKEKIEKDIKDRE